MKTDKVKLAVQIAKLVLGEDKQAMRRQLIEFGTGKRKRVSK